jgi:hypothetical protein
MLLSSPEHVAARRTAYRSRDADLGFATVLSRSLRQRRAAKASSVTGTPNRSWAKRRSIRTSLLTLIMTFMYLFLHTFTRALNGTSRRRPATDRFDAFRALVVAGYFYE